MRPDFARAADLGVTSSAIAETLRIATVGDYDVGLPKLNLVARQVPIVVKAARTMRARTCRCSSACRARRTGPVLLGQVATLEFSGGPPWWTATTARATSTSRSSCRASRWATWTQAVAATARHQNLPPGVRQITIGDAEMMGELFTSFWPGHAHGRAVHLHRAGAAVQGLPAPGHHPWRALPLSLGGRLWAC